MAERVPGGIVEADTMLERCLRRVEGSDEGSEPNCSIRREADARDRLIARRGLHCERRDLDVRKVPDGDVADSDLARKSVAVLHDREPIGVHRDIRALVLDVARAIDLNDAPVVVQCPGVVRRILGVVVCNRLAYLIPRAIHRPVEVAYLVGGVDACA